jgi:prepilin-type N-terminal cleavage/methylation domain-containing protein
MKLSFQKLSRVLRGFTLIELLVVLAIVGILMSLMFPAVNGALNSARRASAQNDVVQIANSALMFQTEYGRWPATSTNSATVPMSSTLIQSLIGRNTNDNPRRVVFLEVPDFKPRRGGLEGGESGTYKDPWGNTYQLAVDGNYDHSLSFSAGRKDQSGATNVTLRKTTASFNVANSVADRNASNFFRNVVHSW